MSTMPEDKGKSLKTDESEARVHKNLLRRQVVIALSAGDSTRFAEALLDPPAPNDHIKRAAARHKQLITGS